MDLKRQEVKRAKELEQAKSPPDYTDSENESDHLQKSPHQKSESPYRPKKGGKNHGKYPTSQSMEQSEEPYPHLSHDHSGSLDRNFIIPGSETENYSRYNDYV